MQCLSDPSEIELFGKAREGERQFLLVGLSRCTGSESCKSEAEIDKFLMAKRLEWTSVSAVVRLRVVRV